MRIVLLLLCLMLAATSGHLWAQNAQAGEDPAAVSTELMAVESNAAEAVNEPNALAEFISLMAKGGTTVLLLMVLSIIAMSYGVERLARLRRSAVVPQGLGEDLLQLGREGNWAAITQRCQAEPSTLGRIALMLVQNRDESKAEVSTLGSDIARRELKGHLQRCYPLAVVATIAPLLGLFGTVYGMIGAFATVATVGSMGDPSVLADDISKALITTAVGLAVAIPALGLYHLLKYKAQIFATALEADASTLIADWFKTERAQAAANAALESHHAG